MADKGLVDSGLLEFGDATVNAVAQDPWPWTCVAHGAAITARTVIAAMAGTLIARSFQMEGMCNYPSAVTTTRGFPFRTLVMGDSRTAVSWSEATVVFVIFTAAQLADGLLTYWGVTTLGIHVEGNDLLATTMYAIGPGRALVSAKLLACICGYILYRTASHRPLAVMAGLYIGVAVTPWLLVFGGVMFGY
jgi:hypothetical protein